MLRSERGAASLDTLSEKNSANMYFKCPHRVDLLGGERYETRISLNNFKSDEVKRPNQ